MAAQMGRSLIPVTIASGQSLSPQIDIGPYKLVGIYLPATWTAANMTFQVSPDGGATWYEHYLYNGVETLVGNSAGAGVFLAIDPTILGGVVSLKLRSGSLASPVVQASAVTLQLSCMVG